MKWVPATPLKLHEVRKLLEKSPTFTRSNNISDLQSYCENLFMESTPGESHIFLLEEDSEVIGFVKYIETFPLPGYTHLRLLVIREDLCGKGHGSKVIEKLKGRGTLWIEPPHEQFTSAFWKAKGFVEEAGRWALYPSKI